MTTIAFWLIAMLLSGVALLFVVLPLLRGARRDISTPQSQLNVEVHRDQLAELDADLRAGNLSSEQYAQARDELKRRLIEDVPQQKNSGSTAVRFNDRRAAITLAAIIPLASIALYALLGNQQGLAPDPAPAAPSAQQQQFTPEQVAEMVERLATRLEQSPQDAQGWALLGRAYYSMRRYGDAQSAFAKAAALMPNDAQMLVDYADALAIDVGQGLVGKPLELINQALKLDPDNPKALTLAGSAAFDSRDYTEAVTHWDKLLRGLPPESEFSRDISASIAKAQQLATLGQGKNQRKKEAAPTPGKGETQVPAAISEAKAPASTPAKPEIDAGPGGVAGTVSLSNALAGRVKPTDTVFIFARATGQKAPLAVIRKRVRDLPVSFALTDASALLPELKISDQKQVIIGARISSTGAAMAKKGDLEGFSKPVKVGSKNVNVTISKTVR